VSTHNSRPARSPEGRSLGRRVAHAVETTANELGGVITANTVENMPVNGRDYTKLIYLNPGVAGSPDQISDSPGSFGEFSMNGARGRSNNYLLDGTDMNDGYRNDPAINQAGVSVRRQPFCRLTPSPKSTCFRTSSPNTGATAGAVVNIVTKSGSQPDSRNRRRIFSQ
jgi:hypothetical protein